MDFIKARGIWIVTVIIIFCGLYYWVVVDEQRVQEMSSLEVSDVSLKGDVNEWSEYYNRLEKKWIGTSKHVRTLQEETAKHYKSYDSKVDSINNTFERIEYKIDQINEMLTDRINDLSTDLESLNEEFSSYKRATQRDVMKMKKRFESIEEKLDNLEKQLEEK